MAWDGNRKLVISSSDGYCSVVSFEDKENGNIIGERLPNEQVPEHLKSYYEMLDKVDFKKFEQEARMSKKE